MSQITYGDKTPITPQVSHSLQWWAEDANEVKTVVNENDTTDTSTSATLLFDKTTGRVHGTDATPIVADLIIDPTGQIEGGLVEVVFQNSVNPAITGVSASLIINLGTTILESGTYSIFIMYTGGKYKINITQKQQQYIGIGSGITETLTTITVT